MVEHSFDSVFTAKLKVRLSNLLNFKRKFSICLQEARTLVAQAYKHTETVLTENRDKLQMVRDILFKTCIKFLDTCRSSKHMMDVS